MDKTLRKELEIPISSSTFWVDSSTVLHYIRNETKSFHTFVSNRIAKIRDSTSPAQWKYVRSQQNVADIASRGMKIKTFLDNQTWINGPDFLRLPVSQWPSQPEHLKEIINDVEEKLPQKSFAVTVDSTNAIDSLLSKYSSWTKLLKITAWILRYISILKSKISKIDSKANTLIQGSFVTVDETKKAELAIIRYLQYKEYGSEIQNLNAGKVIGKSSKIRSLNPIISEDLLRIGGRISRSDFTFNQKHQIILSKSMPIIMQIIDYCHKICGHGGRQAVLSQLRKKYWIINANSVVRRYLNQCVKCKKTKRPSWTTVHERPAKGKIAL